MPFPRCTPLFSRLFALALAICSFGGLQAHNVPSMTIEAQFKDDRTFEISINFDPRAFLASDPRSLPPVPASWYRDQSPEQVAATLGKAREYVEASVQLLFSGIACPLPDLKLQAIDGADNTPLKPETQELHLLATGTGAIPDSAAEFQLAFAKTAAIDLILLESLEDAPNRRPQVVFPGETSRAFALRHVAARTPLAPTPTSKPSYPVIATLVIVFIVVIVGWRLRRKYRHHHRFHRKPGTTEPK